MRLRALRIFGAGLGIHQVLDIGHLLHHPKIVLGRGTRQRYLDSLRAHPQQKVTHPRDDPHLLTQTVLKHVLTQGLQRLSHNLLFPPRNKHRNQLIAAFADLPPQLLQLQMDAHRTERDLPRLRMQPVALHQRPVDITQNSFDHRCASALVMHSSPPGTWALQTSGCGQTLPYLPCAVHWQPCKPLMN